MSTPAERARDLGALLDETTTPATDSGPLDGWQVAIKDVFDVAGQATTGGTPALQGNRRRATATVVRRLLEAGAVVGPRCNLMELSFGITSDNDSTAYVRNPHDEARTAGGSSGGSAVVVATGMVRAALGGDTGGSIRVPASFCGIVGFRPSNGRYPTDGVLPISPTRDTPGPLATSVADVVTLDAVLADAPARPEAPATRRLGVLTTHVADLAPEVEAAFSLARKAFAGIGYELVDVDPGRLFDDANAAGLVAMMYEFPRALVPYLAEGETPLTFDEVRAGIVTPEVQKNAYVATKFNDADAHAEALATITECRDRLAALASEHDVAAFVHPTVHVLPTEVGSGDVFALVARNGAIAGVLGLPAISLPVPVAGVPVGVEVLGTFGSDAAVLGVAEELEAALTERA